MDADRLLTELSSLTVLSALGNGRALAAVREMLHGFWRGGAEFASACASLSALTLPRGLGGLLADELLADGNVFARESVRLPFGELRQPLKYAASRDIAILNGLLSALAPENVLALAAAKYPDMGDFLLALPPYDLGGWPGLRDAADLYALYREHGYGFFAGNAVCVFAQGRLLPVSRPDPVTLSDLKGYERQKQVIIENTELFLSGGAANNILLYGERGTGKSSTVKALANAYRDRGLRLVELKKEDLADLGILCSTLAESPFRFIVFLDDLSFAREDDCFTALKAAIEGGVSARPDNVLIYATSNRRHLVGESFSDRRGDDVHVRDTIETMASLSDRFGLEVVFGSPDRDEYLHIVSELAAEHSLRDDPEALFLRAERFALLKGGRSPRTARQFILTELVEKPCFST